MAVISLGGDCVRRFWKRIFFCFYLLPFSCEREQGLLRLQIRYGREHETKKIRPVQEWNLAKDAILRRKL